MYSQFMMHGQENIKMNFTNTYLEKNSEVFKVV